MWILCTLIGLIQLVTLLMLSGILFSIAAVSRLMEITIILINPTAVFLLRQFANLIIHLTIQTVGMTSLVLCKLCTLVKRDQQEAEFAISQQEPSSPKMVQLQLNMETPFVPYKRSVLEELPKEIRPKEILPKEILLKEILPSTGESSVTEGIIELPQDQSQDNITMEESTPLENGTD